MNINEINKVSRAKIQYSAMGLSWVIAPLIALHIASCHSHLR